MLTAPTSLSAQNVGNTVVLTWTAVFNADGYQIERQDIIVGIVNSPSVKFTDTSATTGLTYTYKVRAFNACGYGDFKSLTWSTTCGPPSLITGVSANQINDGNIIVTWNLSTNTTGYTVERSVDSGAFSLVLTAGPTTTLYDDNSINASSTYTYRVTAFNNCQSSQSSISTPPVLVQCNSPLGPPANLAVTPISTDEIRVNFDSVTLANGSHPTNYIIQRRPSSSMTYATIFTVTNYSSQVPYIDTGLTTATQYCYRVGISGGSCVNTAFSNEQCATTLSALPCNTPAQTFNWSVPRFNEPGLYTNQTNGSDYMSTSPSGQIDMSDPRINQVRFGPDSVLDDVLIMVKGNQSVTETWDGIGNHPATFSIPDQSIIFSNTGGFYVNDGGGTQLPSAMKTFQDSTHTVILPYGSSDIATLTYSGSDIILDIVGFKGSTSCLAMNGTYHLYKINSNLWHQNISGTGTGWLIQKETISSTVYWCTEFNNGTTTTKLYIATTSGNTTPPTDTRQWSRNSSTSCQEAAGSGGMNYMDFVNANFVVRNFATGITKSDLQTYGFIDINGTFSFKFFHVCCGIGNVSIEGLTCSDGNDSCPSVGTCSTCCSSITVVVSGLTGANNSNGTYSLTSSSCTWSNGSNAITYTGSKWQLVIDNGHGQVIWQARCDTCPPTDPSQWAVTRNDFSGTPALTISNDPLTVPDTPTVSWINLNASMTVSIAWNTILGVTNYSLERSTDNSTWSVIATPSPASYTDTGACINCQQCYRVGTVSTCGNSPYSLSDCIQTQSAPSSPTAVGFVSPQASPPQNGSPSQGVTVGWTNGSGTASSTVLYRDASQTTLNSGGGTNVASGSGSATSLNDTSAVSGSTYYYGIHKTYSDGYALRTFGTYTVCTPPNISTLITSNETTSSIDISWTVISGSSEPYYEIFISTDSSTYTFVTETSSNSATISGLSSTTTYWFAVRGVTYEGGHNHQCRAGGFIFASDTTTGGGGSGAGLGEF